MIRQANRDDLPGIAQVHIECFSNSFSTQLGEKLLIKFYDEYMQTNPKLFVVAEERKKVVGFCMGYCIGDRNYMKDFIKNNIVSFAFKCFYLAITGNKQFYNKIKKSSSGGEKMMIIDNDVHNADDATKADLLSICVAPSYRGTGIAQKLMEFYVQSVKNIDKKILLLSVDPNNVRAVSFYTKNNFKKYRKAESFETYARLL